MPMFRTPLIAALTSPCWAEPLGAAGECAAAPICPIAHAARPTMTMTTAHRRGYRRRGAAARLPDRPTARSQGQPPSAQQAQADRDMFCRRDAAARTGYVTPGQAASHEQTNGTVGGTLGGAALGAVIGAPPAMPVGRRDRRGRGPDRRHRGRRRQCPPCGQPMSSAAYADAYYACMHEDRGQHGCGYGPPPPPGYGYPAIRRRRPIITATAPILIPIPTITARRVRSASDLAAWLAWRVAGTTAKASLTAFDCGRPGCMVPAVFFSGPSMPPKANPAKLNPLQLRTLTLLQAIARIPGAVQPDAGWRHRHHPVPACPWRSFPSGRCHRASRDATGLENENGVERAGPQGPGQGRMAASDRADAGRPGL